jgi:hypothetical protein
LTHVLSRKNILVCDVTAAPKCDKAVNPQRFGTSTVLYSHFHFLPATLANDQSGAFVEKQLVSSEPTHVPAMAAFAAGKVLVY